jgi:hypothetical protein
VWKAAGDSLLLGGHYFPANTVNPAIFTSFQQIPGENVRLLDSVFGLFRCEQKAYLISL